MQVALTALRLGALRVSSFSGPRQSARFVVTRAMPPKGTKRKAKTAAEDEVTAAPGAIIWIAAAAMCWD